LRKEGSRPCPCAAAATAGSARVTAGPRAHRRRQPLLQRQGPLTEDQIFAQKTVAQLNAERPLDDVFFDLDKADLREDAKGAAAEGRRLVEEVGQHDDFSRGSLRLARQRRVQPRARIASRHCRERLPGQSWRDASRVTTISKGKETPFCTDESEACWQQNRRGAFRYYR
jgi:peptidoglycan-associated lipoprotein